MPRFLVPLKVVACLLLVGGAVTVLGGLVMQFHIENTDDPIYESAVGADQVKFALVAVPLAIVGIVARRRAVAAAAVAVAALVLGGSVAWSQMRMHPEAGLRRAADDFVPPAGARAVDGPFDGYDLPRLRRSWTLEADPDDACRRTADSLRTWAAEDGPLRPRRSEDDCFVHASRGHYTATASVGPALLRSAGLEVSLTVSRRP